ncbi:dihydropteroate synthase [Nocardia aurea]|uniref:dihydropteroate synthase n=1 Tax=Nocardia aurea TaxID=2144174 RepID=UPI001E499D09|nr:dihydropteroate synthase [Nocardia aurea]
MTIEQLRAPGRPTRSARMSGRPGQCGPMRVMGIVNATPDSFWSGSRFSPEQAVEAGKRMLELGAWCIDVGGESTRPGAVPVTAEQELERIAPVVAGIAPFGRVSVDTRHVPVAHAAVALGASIINDVSGMLHPVAGQLGAAYVGMHSVRVPASETTLDESDVCDDVFEHLRRVARAAAADGITELWIDPGIGFGKTAAGNIALLRALPRLCSLGTPVLLGVSRKSFIGAVTGRTVSDRLAGSLALVAPAWSAGVDIIRVHDVAETVDTVAMLEAVWGSID